MGIKYFYVDSPLYKLESTARACERHFTQIFKNNFSNLGVTQGEFCLMDTVVRSPEISQIELARLLFKGRAHITLMLNTLEKKGLITRIDENKNNRRIRQTILTKQGAAIHKTISDGISKKFEKTRFFLQSRDKEFLKFLDEIRDIITEGADVDFD